MKVELIAYTPEADDVCGVAARTCVSETIPPKGDLFGDWSKSENALRHALASGHESVAEHAVFTFAIEGISRACSHQLVRHRMASYSQQSQRYVNMDNFDYVMPESIQSHENAIFFRHDYDPFDNELVKVSMTPKEAIDRIMKQIADIYEGMIRAGIPEEDARYILPNACCTNLVVTMNGRELMHFFSLRCCTRAQWEIRELAKEMLKQVRQVAPIMFENAGPQCKKLGYCPEAKGCGRYPPKVEALGLDMCVLSEVEE